MPKQERTQVEGRTIYIFTGTVTQTVNICTTANKQGEYEWTVRVPIQQSLLTTADIEKHAPISNLISWLKTDREGLTEIEPAKAGVTIEHEAEVLEEQPPIAESTVTPEDARWISQAQKITELCIDQLVEEFLAFPYLHRVEHSVHARLYEVLHSQPHLDRHVALAGGMVSQCIHKE
jgi:hypothetical protein